MVWTENTTCLFQRTAGQFDRVPTTVLASPALQTRNSSYAKWPEIPRAVAAALQELAEDGLRPTNHCRGRNARGQLPIEWRL